MALLGTLTGHSGWTAEPLHSHKESKWQSLGAECHKLSETLETMKPTLILYPSQEGWAKTSWCPGMAPELLSLSSTSTPPPDNTAWREGFDRIEVCWHPQNWGHSTLHKANQHEVIPELKLAHDYQMMYGCLWYR